MKQRIWIVIGSVVLALIVLVLVIVKPWQGGTKGELERIEGVQQVTLVEDGYQVQLALDLSPEVCGAAYDQIQSIIVDQPMLSSRAAHIIQGPLVTEIQKPLPGVDPGRLGGGLAAVALQVSGIDSGSIDRNGLDVELNDSTDALAWTLRVAEDAELAGIGETTPISVGSPDAHYSLYAGSSEHRKLLNDVSFAIRSHGTITSIGLSGNGPAVELTASAQVTDQQSAQALIAALNQELAGQDADHTLELTFPNGLQLTGLDDPQAALELTDAIQATNGLNVSETATDMSWFSVVADDADALDDFADYSSGWPVGPETQLAIDPSSQSKTGGASGTLEELPSRIQIFQQFWRAGFPEMSISDGRENDNTSLTFYLTDVGNHDFTDATTQQQIIGLIRAQTWAGLAGIEINAASEASLLTFTSTQDGKADVSSWPMTHGDHKDAEWGHSFVDAWDATATG